METFFEFVIQKLRKVLSIQFSRFVIVGTCAFIIDAGLLRLLTTFGVDPYIGRAFSVPPAFLFGFMVNRRFTFRYDGNQRKRVQLSKYALVQGVGAMINYSVFAALLAIVPLVSVYLEIGVAAGALTAMMWNFAMARYLVFSDENILTNRGN